MENYRVRLVSALYDFDLRLHEVGYDAANVDGEIAFLSKIWELDEADFEHHAMKRVREFMKRGAFNRENEFWR